MGKFNIQSLLSRRGNGIELDRSNNSLWMKTLYNLLIKGFMTGVVMFRTMKYLKSVKIHKVLRVVLLLLIIESFKQRKKAVSAVFPMGVDQIICDYM